MLVGKRTKKLYRVANNILTNKSSYHFQISSCMRATHIHDVYRMPKKKILFGAHIVGQPQHFLWTVHA